MTPPKDPEKVLEDIAKLPPEERANVEVEDTEGPIRPARFWTFPDELTFPDDDTFEI